MKNRLFFGAGALMFTVMASWLLVPEHAIQKSMQKQSADTQRIPRKVVSMEAQSSDPTPQPSQKSEVVFPVEEYVARQTYKGFGDYVDDGRFIGYHVAEDIEFVDAKEIDVPVVAITDGIVTYKKYVSGYGGLIKARHSVDGQRMTALYGHVDLASSPVEVGDQLKAGQFLANLGEHKSKETDGRRKHLHFGLYAGEDGRVQGYEKNIEDIDKWLNPSDVFASSGLMVDGGERIANRAKKENYIFLSDILLKGKIFNDLIFVQYVKQIINK